MSEEEKAIDELKCLIEHLGNKYYKVTFTGEDLDFLQTIINLIQKQEKAIDDLNKWKKYYKHSCNDIRKLKNKVIDEMAEYIRVKTDFTTVGNINAIKQYFYRKVEENEKKL